MRIRPSTPSSLSPTSKAPLCSAGPPWSKRGRQRLLHHVSTKGPMWGYPRLVLGALGSFLEPFCGHVLPKVDKLCLKLTFEIPPQRALRGVVLRGRAPVRCYRSAPPGTLETLMVRRWVVANMRLLPQKWPAPPWQVAGSFRWTQRLNPPGERIFIELMTSDRKLEASREGSK